MNRAEGGDALPGAPSPWIGQRWRRRRAWRPLLSTSGFCERLKAPTRPASGPRSGIPGTGAADGQARAGPGHRFLRGCVCPASDRLGPQRSTPLFGEILPNSFHCEACLSHNPGVESPPGGPRPRLLPSGMGEPRSCSRAGAARQAAGARRTDGGS